MSGVYIVDGLRTPIGAAGKSLSRISAVGLGAIVIRALLKKKNIKGPFVDEVILGNAVSAGLGQNPARQALIKAGLPVKTPAFVVNEVCGSGLRSVILAAQAISCGDRDTVVAGGIESASQNPYLLPRDKKGMELNLQEVQDSLITDGLWCGLNNAHMGMLAEWTAERFKISREEQDNYAFQSHKKAAYASDSGIFQRELAPVELEGGAVFAGDEKIRKDVSMAALSKCHPAFKPGGTVTAGNSPSAADGAAALLLMSGKAAKRRRITPLARVIGYAAISVEPKSVFAASAQAIAKCLKASSLRMADVDIFEINESFAAQSLLAVKTAGLDINRLNIFGGAIALGHPLGAQGARCLVTLLNALATRKKKTGIVSICLGGGGVVSLAVRMV